MGHHSSGQGELIDCLNLCRMYHYHPVLYYSVCGLSCTLVNCIYRTRCRLSITYLYHIAASGIGTRYAIHKIVFSQHGTLKHERIKVLLNPRLKARLLATQIVIYYETICYITSY